MLEDTVIANLSSFLEARNFRTLAQGGNQAARFRFRTRHNKSKAPDAVYVKEALLLVVEAKVRASDCFRLQRGSGESDADVMAWVASSADVKVKLLKEAARILAAGRFAPTVLPNTVECAVAAGTTLAPFAGELADRKISGFGVVGPSFKLDHQTQPLRLLLTKP